METKEKPGQLAGRPGQGEKTDSKLHNSFFVFDSQAVSNAIRNIDLIQLVQSHGIQLKKSGNRFVASCPFHNEKTGSFFVFPNNRFYCFGCGASGDAAAFIMKLSGCSFPEALDRLGIKKLKESYSKIDTQAFKKNKIKNSLVKSFRDWESRYSSKLGGLITSSHKKLAKIRTDDDLLQAAWIYPFLSQWKYHMDVLCYGSDQEKYKLFREVR